MKTWLGFHSNGKGIISRIFSFFLRPPKSLPEIQERVAKIVPVIPVVANHTAEREMHLSTGLRAIHQLSSKPRVPAIKFLGQHGSVPKYHPDTSHSGTAHGHKGSHVSIDELDLPPRLRRRMPSLEEIAVINSGGLREFH